MCMHAHEVFISNKIYKKTCNVFNKMVVKNCFHYKCNKKELFETHYSLEKLSASPKNGNPHPHPR